MKPLADVPPGGQGLCSAHRVCQWVSPSLPLQPSTALNGPLRLNGALRNGSQFSWLAGRHSATAVCESLLLGGFHLFPSAPEPWGGGLSFPAPSVPVLHGGGHARLSDLSLAVARAVLCSSRRDLWRLWAALLLPVNSTAFTNVQGHREAVQLCLWVQCASNTPWGWSDPQGSPPAAQEC